jgi:hypothetical protein
MARELYLLTARKVAITAAGRYADGGNLYLSVSPSGTKSWVFMYRWYGKQKEIGIGPARDITLARAREIAAGHRAKLAEGHEPDRKRAARQAGATFGEIADEVMEARQPQWRSEMHAQQWKRSLEVDCKTLRDRPVAAIDTDTVLSVLKPLWSSTPKEPHNQSGSRSQDASSYVAVRSLSLYPDSSISRVWISSWMSSKGV